MSAESDLVFEIGCEELPSSAVYAGIEQLSAAVPKALQDARLGYDGVAVVATPRRLAVLVTQLADRQEDAVTVAKGPAAKAAFDAEGNPTQAAIGFARGKGVPVESLEVRDEDGGSYVYATVEHVGGPSEDVLPALLARLTEELEWAKSQRWGDGTARFPRPVRWMLAIHGTDVVPVNFAGLTAGRVTYGHRFLAPGPIELTGAYEYPRALEAAKVVVDHNERAARLRDGIETAARLHGGTAVVPDKTFAEVVNLVEWPTVGVGEFDEEFLAVPREMLEYAMSSHQRYFPLEIDGSLAHRFIVAHNGDPERTEAIVEGHQRVIRARLADAAFFYREDLAHPLEAWHAKLADVVFQEKLGTVADKVSRIESLAGSVAAAIGAAPDVEAFARRAAHLCKADLVTNAVVEFTDLQGVMGGYYARAHGEDAEVASAIADHYRPRFAGDALPSTLAGRIVSIADKADTICGIFSAGKAPKGSADPFALRRSAIGILQMALGGTQVTLDELIGSAMAGISRQTAVDTEAVGAAVKEFFVGRLEKILRDRGFAYDTVDAVLAVAADAPADALARCDALQTFRESSSAMDDLSVAYTRAKNLSQQDLGTDADVALMGDEERTLLEALDSAEGAAGERMDQQAYGAVLETFATLRAPIDAFFEAVLVMDEDVSLRENRLRLLNRFVALFADYADFSRLAG